MKTTLPQSLILAVVVACASVVLLVGCGGHGGGGAADGRAVITVAWPTRSRLIPAAANSITATFKRGQEVVASQVLSRPANGAQSTATFDNLKVGSLTLTAAAYPNADGTGVAQAQGGTTVAIQSGQTANVTLTMDSTINHIEVTPPSPTVQVGQTVSFLATATDASGGVVLTAPSKLQWASQTPAVATIDGAGVATAVSLGSSLITVTDTESGKGGSVTLTVAPGPVAISPATISMYVNGQIGFVATVTGLGNPDVTWSVQEGAAGGSVDSAGYYIAPSTPGTYHVVATSQADPTKSATATVNVTLLVNNNPAGIYITDYFNNRLIKVDDMSGANWHAFAGFAAPGSFRFTRIHRVTMDAAGRIYVSDWQGHRIVRMDDITGKNLVTLGTKGNGVGQFFEPEEVAIGPDGKIYVADYQNHRIVRFNDMDGSGWTTFGTQGSGVGQFFFPQGIWIAPDNRIYIGDTFNYRLVRIDNMSGAGWVSYNLGNPVAPTGVAVTSTGRIYFSDYYNHRLGAMNNMSGSGLTYLGSTTPGNGVGQFNNPSPPWLDSADRIYIPDTTNDRIIRINDISGAGWTTYGSQGPGPGQTYGAIAVFVRP
jgi:streptogramin lyase